MKTLYSKLSLIFILTILVQHIFAQEKSTIGGFASIPVCDFGSTELENGGFAEPGWGITFDSRMRSEKWPEGLLFHFHSTYQWNKMNTEAVQNAYTELFGQETTVSESRYSPLFTTVGPGYELPLSEKISLGFYPSIGVMFSNTKAFTVKVYDDQGSTLASEVVNFDNRVAFTYVLSLDLNFEIVEDLLGIGLYADYASAK